MEKTLIVRRSQPPILIWTFTDNFFLAELRLNSLLNILYHFSHYSNYLTAERMIMKYNVLARFEDI
jgi:hypothetical protein